MTFRPTVAASLLALMLAPPALADENKTVWRVFIGDHAAPRITAFDLNTTGQTWSFPVTGQAKLFTVAGGKVVAAVQSDDDAVHFFRSGVDIRDHGDHSDIEVADPAAIDTALTGPRPFHLVAHDGKVVINYDLGGYAEILDEDDLARGHVEAATFPQSRAHHGFVTPLGASWLGTVASDAAVEEGASVPRLGLQAFDPDGTPAGDLVTCTAIHGEAFSGAYLAAGCREGVLLATAAGQGIDYRMLPYPADFPDVTTGTLLGSPAMQIFLGNHGPDGLVVIDPEDAPHMRRIVLPFRRVDFVLDPARPQFGYVLTEDGSLHRVNLLTAAVETSAKVTEAYSLDGHWNDPRPRLAVAGDEVLLTDPRAGLLRRIDAGSLQQTGEIAVDGQPYNLTVVGGSGLAH